MPSRRAALVSVIAAALTLGAAAPARDWTATVTQTAQGTHLLGSPKAPLRLTEFVSYTCPHCAHFEHEAAAPLRRLVASGKVAIEVRPFVRDPVDMTVALLTQCGAPAGFFANHAAFLGKQESWIAPLASASAAQRARWTSGPFASRTVAIARDFGFFAQMAARGYGRRQVEVCLADEALAGRLAAATQDAKGKLGITGTPSFALNGEVLAGVHDWASLSPRIESRM